MSTELKRNPGARTAGDDVAESVAVVVEGDIFPLKSGEGGPVGGHLRILLL